MHTFLWASGVVFWAILAITFVARLRRLRFVRRWMWSSGLYPYTSYLRYKVGGWILNLVARRRVPREVIQAMLSSNLQTMRNLRDALADVDRLPTIEKGKRALGLQSIFELGHRSVSSIESPYTHRLQNPPYFLPGVPSESFSDPAQFEWVQPLEKAYPMIKQELLALLENDGAGFGSYMDEFQQTLTGWNTFNFFFYGKKFDENCALCPQTTQVLESLPRFERDHIMFSALNPHAAITPHYGPMNGIVRAHLGLVVPTGCYIKVGDQERTWEEGKVLVFDDSYLHQVWNHSNHVRIVLFMNFWHPCFADEEIAVLERFRTAYEQSPLSRVHDHNQGERRAHNIVRQVRQ